MGERKGREEWTEFNRANWDARTAVHVGSVAYDVEGFIATPRGPRRWELDYLGDVVGLDVVHLQCHIGIDSIAVAHAGATVTGLDFSPAAITAATDIATRTGLAHRARFVLGDVHRAADLLGSASFDLVYVSGGALCWLPHVGAWAAQVAALIRPGGRLYLHDVHPLAWAMSDDGSRIERSYFEADEWNHSIGEIVGALLGHGLRIDRLDEHAWADFAQQPNLRPDGEGRWHAPHDGPSIPRSFTITATKIGLIAESTVESGRGIVG